MATNYNATKVATIASFEAGTALPSDVLSALSGFGTKLRVITDTFTVTTELAVGDTVTIGTLPKGAIPIAVLFAADAGTAKFVSNLGGAAAVSTGYATVVNWAKNIGAALTADTDVTLTTSTAVVAVDKVIYTTIVYADTKG